MNTYYKGKANCLVQPASGPQQAIPCNNVSEYISCMVYQAEHNDAFHCVSGYTKINYIYIPYNKTWKGLNPKTNSQGIYTTLFILQATCHDKLITKTIVKPFLI